MKIYQNNYYLCKFIFFEYCLTNLSNLKKMVRDKKIPVTLFILMDII